MSQWQWVRLLSKSQHTMRKKKCKRNLTNLGKREILVHLDGNGEEEIFFSWL